MSTVDSAAFPSLITVTNLSFISLYHWNKGELDAVKWVLFVVWCKLGISCIILFFPDILSYFALPVLLLRGA